MNNLDKVGHIEYIIGYEPKTGKVGPKEPAYNFQDVESIKEFATKTKNDIITRKQLDEHEVFALATYLGRKLLHMEKDRQESLKKEFQYKQDKIEGISLLQRISETVKKTYYEF